MHFEKISLFFLFLYTGLCAYIQIQAQAQIHLCDMHQKGHLYRIKSAEKFSTLRVKFRNRRITENTGEDCI